MPSPSNGSTVGLNPDNISNNFWYDPHINFDHHFGSLPVAQIQRANQSGKNLPSLDRYKATPGTLGNFFEKSQPQLAKLRQPPKHQSKHHRKPRIDKKLSGTIFDISGSRRPNPEEIDQQ